MNAGLTSGEVVSWPCLYMNLSQNPALPKTLMILGGPGDPGGQLLPQELLSEPWTRVGLWDDQRK